MIDQEPFFDSVCDLANDPGFIGTALRELPEWEWLLPEADRWPDPWKFLLELPYLSKNFQLLFRAAQSQRTAWGRIAEISMGAGSIETSWPRRLKDATKAGDLKTTLHAQDKVFAALWRYDRARRVIDAAQKRLSAPQADWVRKKADALYEKARRKHGRAKAEKEQRPAVFRRRTITQRIAWELAGGWLRGARGAPGYCFFSDSALRDVLAIVFKIHELPFETVRKTRQFVKLEKAPIFIYKLQRTQNESLNLLDRHGGVISNIIVCSESGK